MPFLKTRDGADLYYKSWGDGPPVILIHGWPLTADTWDDTGLILADNGFRVIAYDRRGFGRSEQTWSGYDYDSLADDLADVITELKANNAGLVGFSMGGGEVARYMSRYQGKSVSAAVLVSSVVPYMLQTQDNPDGVPEKTFQEMTTAMLKDRATFFAEFFNDFYSVGLVSKGVSKEVLEWSRSQAMKASLKATLDCAQSFAFTDFRGDLEAFKVPTLIIHGTDDRTVPIDATGRAAAAGIPGAHLIEYSNAPHGLFATHKHTLNDDLLAFLSRTVGANRNLSQPLTAG